MSDFRVELRPSALRELRALDRTDQTRLMSALSELSADIRPRDSRRLRARRAYRLEVNNCRIMYTIDVNATLVVIVAIRHLGDESSEVPPALSS